MENPTLPCIFQEEPDRYTSVVSCLRNSVWETENRTFNSPNMHESSPSYLSCTSVEPFHPDQASTYTTLTPSSFNTSPLHANPPDHDTFLPVTDFLFLPNQMEAASLRDEGLGSSPSNHSLSPVSMENRASPFMQRDSDRGNYVDSDFADGDRVSPRMPVRRFIDESPPHQCAMCGNVIAFDSLWRWENTGHLLCKDCKELQSNDNSNNNVACNNKRKKSAVSAKRGKIFCVNCVTHTTSLWRRNGKGEFVCNACGLYEKLHKRQRPQSMKKDVIQRRKRRPRNTDPKKVTESITPKSTARAFPTPPLLYQPMNESSFQTSGLITLPPMANSHNVLFNYPSDSHTQLLQPSGLGYANNASKLYR